jgi:hypothetical protein
LEANIYLGVFYALYFLLLDKETYYKLNRVYLLCTPVLSYIIPLVQVGWLKSYEDGGKVVATIIYNPRLHQNVATTAYFTWQNALVFGYITGAVVMLTLFTLKISQLLKLTRTQKSLLHNKYKLVKVEDANTAFSFFNYVFIGTNVSGADTMIRHELVHIDQKHSADIVFLELVKIINWFNPFIYLLQRSLKTVHEYIADEQTAAYEIDALTYSSFLVSNAYGLSGSSISNSFFNYNLLKKRIIMLNQKRSGNLARLKYLAALPVCAGLLCASTLGFSKTYGLVYIAPQKTITDTAVKITTVKLVDAKPLKLKQTNTNKPVKITDVKLLPPPPPSKPAKGDTVITMTNTKLSQAKPLVLKEVATNKPVKIIDITLLPPPPPPADPFEAFYKYIQKYVRYPTKGRDNLISGRVIATFNVTNGKMEDLQISRGLNDEMDGEVLRVLKNYDGKFPEQKSIIHYAIPVSFAIMDNGGNYVGNAPKGRFAASKSTKSDDPKTTYMLNEVVVTTYPPKK